MLKMVNEQVRVLGKLLRPMRNTGVYFSDPIPCDGAARLPGHAIDKVSSDAPLMIGEFQSPDGSDYAMLVNLELRRSTKVTIKTLKPAARISQVSSSDGLDQQLPPEGALWLTAGQGVLLHLH
jgi:hypothetical protein